MEVKELKSKGLKREFSITIGVDDLKEKKIKKLQDIASKAEIDGFRPGKVPTAHIEKLYGQSVMVEVIEEKVTEASQSVLQDTLAINDLGKKWSVRSSLKKISESEAGVFVLINHRDASSYWLSLLEGKELTKKSRRVIGAGSQILRDLGLTKIKVLGTPTQYNNISGFNIEIVGFEND